MGVVDNYWREAAPVFAEKMARARDRETEDLLERVIALYAYLTEGLENKWAKERAMAPYLNPLVVLGFDLLRGAHAAQACLSMATAALNARTCFEIRVSFRFIAASMHPPTYAERFSRFFSLERLKRHSSGHLPLEPAEVDLITKDCNEWIDPSTNKPKRRCTWHGLNTFGDLAKAVGDQHLYETYYSSTSAFTHASYAVHRPYMVGSAMQPVANSVHVSQQSLLTVGSLTMFLNDYMRFFGIAPPKRELIEILHRLRAIQRRVAPEQ
jgi:hypothetical protein